jgi:hypothetical protein
VEKVRNIEQGVRKLLELRHVRVPAFRYIKAAEGEYCDVLELEGKRIPLLAMRTDLQIASLIEYGEIGGNSALNAHAFASCDMSMEQLMYREFDIAEAVLHSEIVRVMAYVNGGAANVIATMADGTCANLELGNTLAAGARHQTLHRIITNHGMANDRALDCQTTVSQITLFGADGTLRGFDDDEYYLWGLSEDEVRAVFAIHAIIMGALDASDFDRIDARHRAAVDAAMESARRGECVEVRA